MHIVEANDERSKAGNTEKKQEECVALHAVGEEKCNSKESLESKKGFIGCKSAFEVCQNRRKTGPYTESKEQAYLQQRVESLLLTP